MRIEIAHPAEFGAVLALYDEAVAWLVAHGYAQQWGELPFSQRPGMRMQVDRYLDLGMAVARDDAGRIIGALFAGTSPPAYIRRALAGHPRPALFVEAFVVARRAAGQGVGPALLGWAEQRARHLGLGWLRLDCYADNPELMAYYERAGFQRVTPFWVGEWHGMLWERPVRPAEEGP